LDDVAVWRKEVTQNRMGKAKPDSSNAVYSFKDGHFTNTTLIGSEETMVPAELCQMSTGNNCASTLRTDSESLDKSRDQTGAKHRFQFSLYNTKYSMYRVSGGGLCLVSYFGSGSARRCSGLWPATTNRPIPADPAARTGSLETIKLLLDSGADVNLPAPTGDDWDATPLQHAILARQSGAVRLLLERGADPNRVIGPNDPAPLLLAAGDTDPTFVNLLLAHGADLAIEGESGVTPLSRAVSAGPINGPDPDVRGLPRRNCPCAARARSRASLKAQFRREQGDLVGALPEVSGRAAIDRPVAGYRRKNSGIRFGFRSGEAGALRHIDWLS
jgi:hypothetical protein